MARRNNRLTWRMILLIVALLVGTAGVVVRLVQVQIVDHEFYQAEAKEEHEHKIDVRASRGVILDRNGFPLVTTVDAFDIYIDPRTWSDDQTALRSAAALAPLLEREPADLISATRAIESGEYLAARSASDAVGLELMAHPLVGVRAVETSQRFYPEGDVASELLGFIGRDQIGLAGIEADYDRELGGQPGEIYFERDGLGNPLPFGRHVAEEPVPGGDVQLTIDRYIQRLVEDELDKQIKTHSAKGGTIIVMDPKTGEVLAMTSRPSFRLSQLNFNDQGQADLYRNRAVMDVYEPGSVMKSITMASAIDLGLVNPNTTYFDSGEAFVEGGEPILNWDKNAYGTMTMTQVLQYSLNTGAVWVSRQMGATRFYEAMKRFGFGTATDVGLGGEAAGIVRTNEEDGWYPVDLATNAYGQGISVTPLQMITAFSSLVNGGLLMRPYVVKEVTGPDGHRELEPVVVRQTVSEETSRTMVEMLQAVVDGMPGHLAQVPGYHVGGKTGTTTFPNSLQTLTTFAGFAPADNPRFTMLIKIDEPQDADLGGQVAAPIFSTLAPKMLSYLGIQPDPNLP